MSTGTEPLLLKDAAPPFSGVGATSFTSTRPADLILRSCDGVDFHVHKDILKFASDVFQDMFALATPASANEESVAREGKPVLVLEEPEAVLYKLLCYAYPLRFPQQPRLGVEGQHMEQDFVGIYRAAQKYQLLVVEELLQATLDDLARQPFFADPYRMFAIGKLLGHSELAKAAVFAAVGSDMKPETMDFPELRLLTWSDGQQMLRLGARYKVSINATLERVARIQRFLRVEPQADPTFYTLPAMAVFIWFLQPDRHGSKCKFVATSEENVTCSEWFSAHIEELKAGGLALPHSSKSTLERVKTLSPHLRETTYSTGRLTETTIFSVRML
uniref:BTB domain-containing protein n=1 Tax=Mycena chlorophos TaxID=658473 RepID=A0ABQ0M329_MYCCL|nr:predicted protein [Mycena chlorophos]